MKKILLPINPYQDVPVYVESIKYYKPAEYNETLTTICIGKHVYIAHLTVAELEKLIADAKDC